ncbi:MAG: alpha/beta hydrolase [Candidatus Bipolaricaulota bacterium]
MSGEKFYFNMLPLLVLLGLLSTGQALYRINATINGQIYDTPGGEVGELTPGDWGLPYEEVSFKTNDDLTIEGWFVNRRDTDRAVILAPGRGTNRWDILENAPVGYLHDHGFEILLFDPRTTGLSEGDMYGFGYFESQDIVNAVRFLKEEKGVKKVGVWGGSAGASAAIMASLESDEIGAVVADSPYANLRMAAASYGENKNDALMQAFFPFYMGVARFTLNFDISQKTNLVERVRDLETPLFLIHGLEDRALKPENSQLLYENAGGSKRIWLAEGAWHVGAHELYPERYQEDVTEFFDSYLDRGRGS